MRELRKIEPTLAKQVRKDFRKIAAPVQKGVKNSIPATAPLSGMVTPIGRLSWGRGKPAKNATIDTRLPRKNSLTGTLVKIRVGSAATVLADMAGRTGSWINAKPMAGATKNNEGVYMTSARSGNKIIRGYRYTYHTKRGPVIGGRVHRIKNQGRGLIAKLGKKASRYAWPGAEAALPQARSEMRKVLEDAYTIVNANMRKK